MDFLLIGLGLLVFNLFLGNFAYLLTNNLPQRSESALNLNVLKEIGKDMNIFRHHRNQTEYHSWISHVPLLGYLEHKNFKIVKYELLVAAVNFATFALVYLFSRQALLLNNSFAMISNLFIWSVILMLLETVFIVDLRHYIIPDFINLLLFVSSLLLLVVSSMTSGTFLWGNLITGVVIFLLFFILGIISGGMGGGDMKFIISSGIIFGPQVVFLVFFSSLLGILYRTVIVPVFKLNLNRETPADIKGKKVFPFGPFLVISSFVLLIFSSSFAILLANYIQMIASK